MDKIQMVDLKSQYKKIKTEVDKAVIDVIESSAFINGPDVKAFQKELEEYLNVKHVIPCANGTDALQLALMALGLKPGDEVITADFTFAATVEVIALMKLVPVLVDVDPKTFNIDAKKVRKSITNKTKAIIPVHLYGQCADMEQIQKIAKEYDLAIIEDTAQAIGSEYTFSNGKTKKAGTIGDIGTTSFFPSKNLGGYGDGGAAFTNNDKLAEKLRAIANHGMTKRYYHDLIGVNSRLDSIQAAILRIKLPHLNDYIAARQKAAGYYNKAFKGVKQIETPYCAKNSTHVFHQYTLKLNGINRDKLVAYLAKKDIPAMIYYPVALHNQKAYRGSISNNESLEVTNDLCTRVISLPMHTELSEEQLEFITTSIIEFTKK